MSDIKSSDLHTAGPTFCNAAVSSLPIEENHSCQHKNVVTSYHAKLFFFHSPIISTPLSGMLWFYSPLISANVSITFWNRATQIGTWTHMEGFLGGTVVKNPLTSAGDMDLPPGWEDPLEKELETHSSVLAWKIPWTEEPGQLQSMGSQCVRHTWAAEHACTHAGTQTQSKPTVFQLRSCIWFQDLMKLRFLMSHCRKNLVRHKVIGKKWIYLEGNTL